MFKKCCLLIFLLVVKSFSQTTELEVIEGPEFKEKLASIEVIAIHSTKTKERGIIKFSNEHMIFDVFGQDLSPVFSEIINIHPTEVHKASLYFDDHIKLFTVVSPKRKEREVYCYNFNIKSRTYTKKLLFKKVFDKKQSLFSGNNKRQTRFVKSPNGKYLAILIDRIKENKNSYEAHVYDAEKLEQLYKKDYQVDVDKFFIINHLKIDDSANVFVVGKSFLKGKSDKKVGEVNYEFVLKKISKDAVLTSILKLEEEFIHSLYFSNLTESIQLYGFYSNKSSFHIKGGCFFKFDLNSLLPLDKKKEVLPKELFASIHGDKQVEKKEIKELKNFYLNHVLNDTFDNTYLVAEEFFVTRGQNGIPVEHYNDILVLKFDVKGNLVWANNVIKNSKRPSYKAFVLNDQIHLLLNSGKNVKEQSDGRNKISKGLFESSSLYDIVFDKSGKVSYNKIQDNKKNNDYWPADGLFTKDNTFIMMDKSINRKRRLMLLK